jgi:hypothetical protein
MAWKPIMRQVGRSEIARIAPDDSQQEVLSVKEL